MYKKIISFSILVFLSLGVFAQKQDLKFDTNNSFKIIQFTDIHYKYDDQGNSQIALDRMNEVLDAELPDLVVFTGDVVVSNEAFKGLDIVLDVCEKRELPYAVVFGNHDHEYDRTRVELYDYISSKPYSMMPERNSKNVPDYTIEVKSSDNSKISSVLYLIDSNAYTQIHSVPGYDWIKFDQIGWYRNESKKYTKMNDDSPLPSLAFFHIPLPEYKDAIMEEKNRLFGIRGEMVCSPTTNSGFFTSIKECGDVMGTFVGHDHDNDFAVMYKEVLLAYGRYTGGNTVYNNLGSNGARVIVMEEGERRFKSYVRLADNQIVHPIVYPDSFK